MCFIYSSVSFLFCGYGSARIKDELKSIMKLKSYEAFSGFIYISERESNGEIDVFRHGSTADV